MASQVLPFLFALYIFPLPHTNLRLRHTQSPVCVTRKASFASRAKPRLRRTQHLCNGEYFIVYCHTRLFQQGASRKLRTYR